MSSSLVWYFAYGVNMNPQILASRKVEPTHSLVAKVPGMRLAFEMVSLYRPGTGDATIRTLHSGEQVPEAWGVLHRIPLSALDKHLDYWEAVDKGHYRRKEVEVVLSNNQKLQAITYEALYLDGNLKPAEEYLKTILVGAEAFGLPDFYLQFLRSLPHSAHNRTSRTILS